LSIQNINFRKKFSNFDHQCFYVPSCQSAENSKKSRILSAIRTKPSFFDYLQYAVFRLSECILRLIPACAIDAFGSVLGRTCWHLMKNRRQTVERNCRIAYGTMVDTIEMVNISKSIFSSAGANLLGGMKTATMSEDELLRHVTVLGFETLSKYLANSQHGAILAIAHMGNWEILARMNPHFSRNRPCAVFFRPLNNPLMNDLVARRREQSGTVLFSNKDGFTKASTHLRSGGLLGVLADQHAGRSGVDTPFFGRNTSCTPLIEIMHRRTSAAIFHVSVIRTAPAHWTIELRPHVATTSSDTPAVMQGLEKSILRSPKDAFWFHNRWKIPQKRPFDLRQTRSSVFASQQAKPWQVVVILSKDPSIRVAALPAVEKLAGQEPNYHFLILADEATFHAANVKWIPIQNEQNLGATLRELDIRSAAPLDLVLFFTTPDEQTDTRKTTKIPWNAGFSQKNSHTLSIRVPSPTTSFLEASTWYHFIDALGSKAP
jgi:KDO2-lipid IV(A) lauroyltransferase